VILSKEEARDQLWCAFAGGSGVEFLHEGGLEYL
jgi:hypothetical protein